MLLQSPPHSPAAFRVPRLLLCSVLCLLYPVLLFGGPAILEVPANSTDVEIQQALDRVPASGGEVHLAAGTYVIHQPILLQRDNVTLRGSGMTTILQLADDAGCPVVILGAPFEKVRRSPSHVKLSSVFINGNREHQKNETWKAVSDGSLLQNNGVIAWEVKDALIEGVTCTRCRSGGLVCAHGVRRLTVRDFTAFDNEYDGLACYETEDSQFTKLFLHDNLAAGISLDLAFNNNVVSDAKLASNDLGIFMRNSCNNTFKSVTVLHSHHHGVFMAQAGDHTKDGWRLEPGTQCTGNTFADLVVTGCGGKAFLVNNDTCTNNAIVGMTFQDNGQGGLAQAAPHLVHMQATVVP